MPADAFKPPPIVPAGEYRMDSRIYDGEKETYASIKTYAFVKANGLHVLKMR